VYDTSNIFVDFPTPSTIHESDVDILHIF